MSRNSLRARNGGSLSNPTERTMGGEVLAPSMGGGDGHHQIKRGLWEVTMITKLYEGLEVVMVTTIFNGDFWWYPLPPN